jgi:hypothetical protein
MERGEAVLVRVGDRLTRLRIARGLDPAAAARAAGIDEERLDAAEIFGGQTTPVQNLVGG